MKLSFGEWLVLRRRQSHLTQGEIADELKVKPQTISGWERNKAEPSLTPFQTAKLCEMLNVSLDQLNQAFIGDIKLDD